MRLWKALFGIICIALAGSPLAAESSTQNRLVGALKLIASPKSSVELANPFDILQLPNVTLPFDIAPVSGRNQVRSTFEWLGKSKVQNNVSWSLSGPGEATADWQAGKVTLDLPFTFVFNGVRLPIRALFTSEAGSDAFGPNGGSVRKLSDSEAEVNLVSSVTFFFNWKDVIPSGENKREEWVGRITFTGRLEALNGGKLF